MRRLSVWVCLPLVLAFADIPAIAEAPFRVDCGTIVAIEIYRASDNQPINVGAVLGGIAGGVIGHQYRALVDFRTGRYAYCKISGQSGPSRDQLVTTPRACGG